MWAEPPKIHFNIQQLDPSPQFQTAIPNIKKINFPIAEVRLGTNDQWTEKISVLLDSGAIISVFTKSYCEFIGLHLEAGSYVELGTFNGGKLCIYIHKIDIKIDNQILRDVHVGFKNHDKGTNVLGVMDVFNQFGIYFDMRNLNLDFF